MGESLIDSDFLFLLSLSLSLLEVSKLISTPKVISSALPLLSTTFTSFVSTVFERVISRREVYTACCPRASTHHFIFTRTASTSMATRKSPVPTHLLLCPLSIHSQHKLSTNTKLLYTNFSYLMWFAQKFELFSLRTAQKNK